MEQDVANPKPTTENLMSYTQLHQTNLAAVVNRGGKRDKRGGEKKIVYKKKPPDITVPHGDSSMISRVGMQKGVPVGPSPRWFKVRSMKGREKWSKIERHPHLLNSSLGPQYKITLTTIQKTHTSWKKAFSFARVSCYAKILSPPT